MAILNRVFERPAGEDVTKSLGNILVSGVENEGKRKLYFHMLMDLLHEKKTIVLVNGSLSRKQYEDLRKFVRPHMVGRAAYDLNMSGESDAFDVMSAFQTAKQKADFLTALLSMSSEFSALQKSKVQSIYYFAISALDALGRKYSLKDLSMMDVDYILDMVSESPIPDSVKDYRKTFLEDASTYSAYSEIVPCMIKLESSGLLDMLSGDLKVEDLLRDGNVVMLNGMLSDDFEQKERLINALFFALSKCLERCKSAGGIAFLIKDADFISGDYIKSTLEYNHSYPIATYIFVEDISLFVSKNGNEILDEAKAFLVFTQGSDVNAAVWSSLFCSRDVLEKSYSYTHKKSWNPLSRAAGGGVISSPKKYDTASTTVQKVNKPNYPPEVFMQLKPYEVMCYLRDPLRRRKTKIEE